MSLKTSPLGIEQIDFLEIKVTATDFEGESGQGLITTRRNWHTHKDDPLKKMLVLQVTLTAEDPAAPPPYEVDVTARGFFRVHEGYPKDRADLLIEVNGASILYGAVRELVSNFTARSMRGTLILESLSFAPSVADLAAGVLAGKTAVKKRAKGARPK